MKVKHSVISFQQFSVKKPELIQVMNSNQFSCQNITNPIQITKKQKHITRTMLNAADSNFLRKLSRRGQQTYVLLSFLSMFASAAH